MPYISDPDAWYQHLLDLQDDFVERDSQCRFIMVSRRKHRELKEMEARQMRTVKIHYKPGHTSSSSFRNDQIRD